VPSLRRETMKAAQEILLARENWSEGASLTEEESEAYDILSYGNSGDWPMPDPGKKPEGVALIGKAWGPLLAPWWEKGWEVWGLNEAPHQWSSNPPLSRYQRWFQLHPPRYLEKHYPSGIKDLENNWGEKRGIKLYMDRHYEEYPDSEPYPKEAVEKLTRRGAYHCSSMDWMLALAIREGFRKIICAGFNLVTYPLMNGEPISGRSCLEYWAGVADGREIDLEFRGPSRHLFQNLHMAVYQSDRLERG